ncbi:phenylalanine--tRNA ligase subunit beta [Desulfuribacillus alkaliarsenatis]|uniref:Phenylalanine--tRNA ligase beta subunit n=1 Tax=Desulfuribacillus alkaliarsenatis TaxID=766136 RepID=A0A1E5FYU8_9FIRM|nr:phenylalanine--tRNA ligase subunit beta [Desulfuribacillus alkaliarsenatis]OEF95617.1 phenylalanine--tRNA ligase subunit beta [Desulfuribacillus alkaliarsenatis]
MNVSYKWLSEWIDLTDVTPEIVADKLTNAGIEVDSIDKLDQGVQGVVVGKVLKAEQHPNADKLRVCTVDVGESEPLQIVCGAANVAKDQLVPVAKVGAVLPGNFKIKKSKLRGVESQGMICSGQELGLENKYIPKELQDGIYVLPENYPLGSDVRPIFNLDDTVLELDLTPNRSDCLSMRGVAYEMAALLNKQVKKPQVEMTELEQEHIDKLITLDVQDSELCPRYAGRIVKGVTIGPSPMWLRNRLQAAGIRSINNIVDITNLILLEYGQPLHAFDYDRLANQKVVVRRAKANEMIKTLDEIERKLTEDMLVIADDKEAIAIAGVMGGYDSEVTSETKNIFIESACFNSVSVRKTSTAFGLRTEASIRFEKGTDPNIVTEAVDRAAVLMAQLGGGEIVQGIVDSSPGEVQNSPVAIEVNRINQRVGTELTKEQMIEIFNRLQFTVKEQGDELLVSVPTRRRDITIAEDLSEEVARLYGYENIPTTLPIGQSTQGRLTDEQQARRRVRDCLISAGWYEAVSYSFINPNRVTELELNDDIYQKMIPLKMPLSEERSHLRTTMLPSMLELAQYNSNHKNEAIKLFELGKVFRPKELPLKELPEEKITVAGIAYGNINGLHWSNQTQAVDFYYVKGVLEQLFSYLGLNQSGISYRPVTKPALHPGQTAVIEINGEEVGYIGQLHPKVIKQFNLPKTYYFELDYEKLLEHANFKIQYQSLPRYPAIKRDIAMVIAEETNASDIMDTIKKSGGDLLIDIQLFDVYAGKGIEAGKKSLAFSLTYRNREKTLTDEEVQVSIDSILAELESKWQAELRK